MQWIFIESKLISRLRPVLTMCKNLAPYAEAPIIYSRRNKTEYFKSYQFWDEMAIKMVSLAINFTLINGFLIC